MKITNPIKMMVILKTPRLLYIELYTTRWLKNRDIENQILNKCIVQA